MTVNTTFTFSKRTATILYWVLGILAMTASAAIIHAKDDASLPLLGLFALGPLLLVLAVVPFFPDDF